MSKGNGKREGSEIAGSIFSIEILHSGPQSPQNVSTKAFALKAHREHRVIRRDDDVVTLRWPDLLKPAPTVLLFDIFVTNF